MALKYCGTAVMLRYCSTRSVKKVEPGWDPALLNPAQSYEANADAKPPVQLQPCPHGSGQTLWCPAAVWV
jgi:hypothetical protein